MVMTLIWATLLSVTLVVLFPIAKMQQLFIKLALEEGIKMEDIKRLSPNARPSVFTVLCLSLVAIIGIGFAQGVIVAGATLIFLIACSFVVQITPPSCEHPFFKAALHDNLTQRVRWGQEMLKRLGTIMVAGKSKEQLGPLITSAKKQFESLKEVDLFAVEEEDYILFAVVEAIGDPVEKQLLLPHFEVINSGNKVLRRLG